MMTTFDSGAEDHPDSSWAEPGPEKSSSNEEKALRMLDSNDPALLSSSEGVMDDLDDLWTVLTESHEMVVSWR